MNRSLGGWKCDKNTSFLGGFLDRVLDSGSGWAILRCYSAQNEIARGCPPNSVEANTNVVTSSRQDGWRRAMMYLHERPAV